METIELRLPAQVINRSKRLLPMLYTVNELANELRISDRTIRDWLPQGLPHEKDSRGHVWINGEHFAGWAKTVRAGAQRPQMKNNEMYCLRCRRAVTVTETVETTAGNQRIRKGGCPICGNTVTRGIALD